MKNIVFIINPISGTQGNKKKLPKVIAESLDPEQWMWNVAFTGYKGHAIELARQYTVMGFDAVVAVGGDGTINEVAQGIVSGEQMKRKGEGSTAMGIIPMGSGNGLARHLGIPVRTQKALEMLNHSEPICIDYGMANDKLFVSTCGTGFDALVAYDFATAGTRGLKTYVSRVMKDLVGYKPETYRMEITEKGKGIVESVEHKAFLLTFANSSQWGYEAKIAPRASVQDGLMDICMMSPQAWLGAPGMALRLFTGNLDGSLFMDTFRAKDVMLYRETESPFHIDGDPVKMEKDIRIRIVPEGLKVLVEKRF